MSIFSGQFGSFGGGYITGPRGVQSSEGRSDLIGAGGGYIYGGGAPMGAMTQAPMVQEVPIGAGAVVYQAIPVPSKPRQPGRQMPRYNPKFERTAFSMPVSPGPGHMHWQGRY